jgi:biotin operon repressor
LHFFCLILYSKSTAITILKVSIIDKFQRETLKKRLLRLAILKSTGAPADLAIRFEISERSVKRIVQEIRDDGTDIRYSQLRRSYVTDEEYQ